MTIEQYSDATSSSIARKVGEATIRGQQVSFFTPPHSEPDCLWVDMEELARAFIHDDDVPRAMEHVRKFNIHGRAYATARNEDRIAIIVCHAMAQGFCGYLDHCNGHDKDDDFAPCSLDYLRAFSDMECTYRPADGLDDLLAKMRNVGGPFMREKVAPAQA